MRPRPHIQGPQHRPRGGTHLTLADRIEPEGAGRRGDPPNLIAERLWTLLPTTSTLHTNDDIISADTLGKANGTSTTGNLFSNFFNRSVMVKGQLTCTQNDGLTRRAVSTDNFTVSPRG
jgi:hypothetical protein